MPTPSPSEVRPARASSLRAVAAVIVVALAAFATFPAPSRPPSATLDGSWVAELNRLATLGNAFGRDLAFTYGPLGYLLYPMDVGTHLVQASVLRFAFVIGFALLVAWRLARAPDLLAAGIFAAAQVTAVALGLSFEYQLLVPLPLAAACAAEAGSIAAISALAVFAVSLLFVKTSAAAGALAVLGCTLVIWVFRGGPRAWAAVAAVLGSLGVTLLVLATLFLRSAADLGAWLRASFAIASSFSEAMSWIGPAGEVALAAAALVAWAVVAALLAWRRRPAGTILLVSIGPVFFAFKHAFVRQDGAHVFVFFPYLLAVLGLVALDARRRAGRIAIGVAMCSVALAGFWVASASRGKGGAPISRSQMTDTLSGRTGASAVASWSRPSSLRVDYGIQQLQTDHVPGLREIARGRTVGVVPWELAVCAIDDLDCRPNPTLQVFSAYTSDLDNWSALHYAAPAAPHLVLAHFSALDGRNIGLDTPLLWRALLRSYEVSPIQPTGAEQSVDEDELDLFGLGQRREVFGGKPFLVLRRRALPRPSRDHVYATASAPGGTWIPVPPSPGRISARIVLDPNLSGTLMRAAFRIPPVELAVHHQGGRTAKYRITPGTARNGLPIDELPGNAREFVQLLRGERLADRIEAMMLTGPGLAYYRQPCPITWIEDEADTIAYDPALPGVGAH